jgi:hypothetical protein
MSTRKRPAPRQGNRPSRNTTNVSQSTAYRPEDGYAAPTADERHEAQLIEELQARGFGITVPCIECGHPLSTEASLARHVGPKCAAKGGAA